MDDAAELTDLVRRNRRFLAPWEPERNEGYFTEAAQRAGLEQALTEYAAGRHVPWGIADQEGQLVGRININDIVRGAFQSGHLGYWVSEDANGRGVASSAVAEVLTLAFGTLGLHRLQAGTLRHNLGSQRVLERNGFVAFGVAADYLRIAGQWQDHVLYQLLAAPP